MLFASNPMSLNTLETILHKLSYSWEVSPRHYLRDSSLLSFYVSQLLFFFLFASLSICLGFLFLTIHTFWLFLGTCLIQYFFSPNVFTYFDFLRLCGYFFLIFILKRIIQFFAQRSRHCIKGFMKVNNISNFMF